MRQQRDAARFAVGTGLPAAGGLLAGEAVQQLVHRRAFPQALVAQQHHVAAGLQRHHSGFGVADQCAVNAARAFHAQVVAEDGAVKPQLAAQDVLQPFGREPGRALIDLGVNHVRWHDAGQRAAQPRVRRGVLGQQGAQAARIDRHLGVRVSLNKAVAGEVLAAIGHARLQQAVHQTFGQQGDDARVAVEGAVANHAALAPIQIQHRRKAEVHAARAQLAGQHVARCRGRVGGAQRAAAGRGFGTLAVVHPHCAQRRHWRQMRKAVGAKALHAPAFVVHANEQVVTHSFDGAGQFQQLGAVVPVARKQDHAAGQRVRQAAAVGVAERGAGDVKNQGSVFGHGEKYN